MKSLTVSSLEAHTFCANSYNLRYNHGVKTKRYKPALVTGSAAHDAGEALHQGGSLDDMLNAVASHYEDGEHLLDFANTKAMIKAYYKWEDRPKYTFAATEMELKAPLREGFEIRGKCDGLIWCEEDQGFLLYELKTTSDTVVNCREMLLDGVQIHTYCHVLESMGFKMLGTVIEVIKKPLYAKKLTVADEKTKDPMANFESRMMKQYAAEPDRMFLGLLVPRNPAAELEALKHFRWMAMDIELRTKYSHWTRPRGHGCKTAFGDCDYKKLCKKYGNVDPNPDGFTTARPHEELSEEPGK
jgi:hypothetical protein